MTRKTAMLCILAAFMLLLCVSAFAQDAPADNLGDLGKISLQVGYIQSFEAGHESGQALLAQYPLWERSKFNISLDTMIIPSSLGDGGVADFGIGLSTSIANTDSRLSVGVGYVAKDDYGAVWYVSWRVL